MGPDLQAAKTLAAQINGQLASGVPAALSFDAISVVALRDGWLEHHELVLRSSVQTIARYRTATEHLLRFLTDFQPVRSAAEFKVAQAETFVRYLSGELGETSPGLAAILSGPGYHGHPGCRHAVQLSDRRRRRFDLSSPTAFQYLSGLIDG